MLSQLSVFVILCKCASCVFVDDTRFQSPQCRLKSCMHASLSVQFPLHLLHPAYLVSSLSRTPSSASSLLAHLLASVLGRLFCDKYRYFCTRTKKTPAF